MSTAISSPAPSKSVAAVQTADLPVLLLRIGAGLCFIGHGAFGFITKAAWVPYFGVVGIPEPWAWRMMPLVGAVDVTVGMMVLFAPRKLPLGYMAVWALWTALLRPLAGESFFEAVERAGNYGVPFVLLLASGIPRTVRGWFAPIRNAPIARDRERTVILALQATTVLLLAGHGALGAITGKGIFATHYAAAGLPAGLTATVGWFELALATAIAVRPWVPLLVFAGLWKLATESLWVVAGSPVWEFVERSGSYVAPLALAALLTVVARRHDGAQG
jgi:hypothetical protein